MDADTYFGRAQEVNVSAGDRFVNPRNGRCMRVHGATVPNRKIKFPPIDSRTATPGINLAHVWNDTTQQIQIAKFDGTNIAAVAAGEYGLVSFDGAQYHVMTLV